MDFFARQERSRRTSRFLVAAFALSFAAVVLATTAVAAAVLRAYSSRDTTFTFSSGLGDFLLEHAGLLGLIAVGTLAFMTFASLYRAATLARGGGQVARLLGGTELSGDVADLPRKQLLNVVEEMAIASGLPMPDVYVLEEEAGINAFAAGLTPSDAAIAVTRGAIEQLDRRELQGVIAHEFSHILHGDMRLNQQLIGFSFGILVVSMIGRWLLRAARFGRRGRNSGGTAAAVALGVAFTLIGAIGLLLSRLIKAGVSRERERLADASAVQFTREPEGLASALKKIGGYTARLTSVDSEEVAHMLFERASPAFRGLLATHPPLVERIRALDPSFDPRELKSPQWAPAAAGAAAGTGAGAAVGPGIGAVSSAGIGALPAAGGGEAAAAGGPAAAARGAAAAARGAAAAARGAAAAARGEAAADAGAAPGAGSPSYRARAVPGAAPARATSLRPGAGGSLLARAGEIESPELAAGLRAALPEAILSAAHSRDESLLLVLALALSTDRATRDDQRPLLEAQLGRDRASRCEALHRELAELDPKLRIPVLELTLPALKQRPAEQLEYLFELLARLVGFGGEQRLFDYVLLRMLAAYLNDLPERPLAGAPRTKLSTREACETLLAIVAAFGHERHAEAQDAFRSGVAAISGAAPDAAPPNLEADLTTTRDLARLDAALARLARLAPRHKKSVLAAVLVTIRHDRRIGVEEIELFRAIAATLGCPLPPTAGLAHIERATARAAER